MSDRTIGESALEAIEAALPVLDELPRYWLVACQTCGWTAETWHAEEASARAEVHISHTGGHRVETQPTLVADDPPAALGIADESDDEPERKPVGECIDCGEPILQGEWHVLKECKSDRIPDNTAARVDMGIPDEETAVRVCADCSDRDQDEFPEAGDE